MEYREGQSAWLLNPDDGLLKPADGEVSVLLFPSKLEPKTRGVDDLDGTRTKNSHSGHTM